MAKCVSHWIFPWRVCFDGAFTFAIHHNTKGCVQSALSGLDIALWDIKGRKLGAPIWQLIGGKMRDQIKAYVWLGGRNTGEVFENAMVLKQEGFTTVNIDAI